MRYTIGVSLQKIGLEYDHPKFKARFVSFCRPFPLFTGYIKSKQNLSLFRYCFVCHTCGPVLDCPTCFRVFHESCLNRIYNSDPSVQFADEQCSLGIVDHSQLPPNGPCPSCRRACNIKLDKTTTKVDLRSIYSTILEKMRGKNHWRTLCTVGYVNDSRRNSFFSFKDMNTRIISDKLKDGLNSYPTRTHLLADLDIIVHNAAVIYGCKAEMTNTARQLRTLIQKELMESSLCVDCYLRTKGGRPDARQNVQACRKAHKLIWFQFSSWSFRPCKVLSETSDGYEVICFDGRRERHFVPTNRAVQMSFTATQLGMRVTAALKHALDDAERYYENQKKVTPDLTYAEGLKHDDMVASSPANSVYSTSSATQSQPQTSKITAPKRRMDSNNRKTAPRPSPVSSKSTRKLPVAFVFYVCLLLACLTGMLICFSPREVKNRRYFRPRSALSFHDSVF